MNNNEINEYKQEIEQLKKELESAHDRNTRYIHRCRGLLREIQELEKENEHLKHLLDIYIRGTILNENDNEYYITSSGFIKKKEFELLKKYEVINAIIFEKTKKGDQNEKIN